MPLYHGTHNKLEQGEFRVDAVLGPIEQGSLYKDGDGLILLFKGWLHNWGDQFIAMGIIRSLLKRTADEGNLMVSFNTKDYDNNEEIVPD